MTTEKKKIRFDEVTLMRTILAALILFMHAFTCYQGGWTKPEGCIDIPIYKWIARTAFAFTLEAFVFISGYLFAFQYVTLNKTSNVVTNKLKRLILPSIIFSVLYFLSFYEYQGLGNFIYSIINGCGHMWYLPMLFWCFVGVVIIQKINIGDGWKLLLFVFLNLFWLLPLPLQCSATANYIFYFYLGYVVYKHSEKIKSTIKSKHIVLIWIAFLIVFIILRPLKETISIGSPEFKSHIYLTEIARNLCQLIYATIGTITFYITVIWFVQKKQLNKFVTSLASCCFGIYIIHQFLLVTLYYKTNFASAVGPYWLPWCGFVLVISSSYLLSLLMLKTRLGKFLIG